MHNIINVYWYRDVNRLKLRCQGCTAEWLHRADRWTTRCPNCNTLDHLKKVRERYVKEKQCVKQQLSNLRQVCLI